MIKKIAHLSDIHIRKSPNRDEEYYYVFDNLFLSLKKEKPDRIVVVGDVVENYINIQGEQLILMSYFFNNLADIAKVIVIRGNHDYESKNKKRVDTIEATLNAINNKNIVYYNETNFYDDENVTWAVWKHGDKKISPWKMKSKNYNESNTIIDLFHNTVNGSVNSFGYEFNAPTNVNLRDLKGEYSFFGHIHKQQFLGKDSKKAYAGSLIAQAFDEGDDNFHGYILWDIENKSSKLIPVDNEYSYKNIIVNSFTDFNDLDLEIENVTKYMRLRVIWRTLPYYKSVENENKIETYLKATYKNIVTIVHKEEFMEDEKIEKVDDDVLSNIDNADVQHKIFREYFEKIGVEDSIIDEIINLDNTINNRIDSVEYTNIQWDILRFGGKNFMSYENFDIDWSDKSGLFQIVGKNTGGKTTLFKALLYTLYNKTPETKDRVKNGDYRYVNNRNNADGCETYVVLSANSEYYGVKRNTTIKKNKSGEISGAPTVVSYFKLNNYNDELTEENSIENLNEETKVKTQKIIERIIGDYDNFMRVVFTTSDTLNIVLSNDMAVFIDSLLYDSGLDLFDRKLTEYKTYIKEIQSNKPRISCNIASTEETINELNKTIENEKLRIDNTNVEIDNIRTKINVGSEYLSSIQQKLYEVDNYIFNLNIVEIQNNINNYNYEIKDLNEQLKREKEKLNGLAESFDEDKYNDLNLKIENFKVKVNNIRNKNVEKNSEINNLNYKIQTLNGEIFKLTNEGNSKKEKYLSFKNSPVCPNCKQKIVGDQHKDIVNDILSGLKDEMITLSNKIETIKNVDIAVLEKQINNIKFEIKTNEEDIILLNTNMENILVDLGELTNHKNDVIKRKEINAILENLPLKIQIVENNINNANQLIEKYNNNLKMIESNKDNNIIIGKAKEKLSNLNTELHEKIKLISEIENNIKNLFNKINELNNNIEDFKTQERNDKINELYEKCIHRNGLPKQMLSNYIIPKINKELNILLKDMLFNVSLDEVELRPKLTYRNNSNSTIDAISSSGKERTFASLSLKMALIAINKKSKPKIVLLDEVTGKLVDESVVEFTQLLYAIKKRVNKLVIVEHTNDIEPNYVLDVVKNEQGISSVELN